MTSVALLTLLIAPALSASGSSPSLLRGQQNQNLRPKQQRNLAYECVLQCTKEGEETTHQDYLDCVTDIGVELERMNEISMSELVKMIEDGKHSHCLDGNSEQQQASMTPPAENNSMTPPDSGAVAEAPAVEEEAAVDEGMIDAGPVVEETTTSEPEGGAPVSASDYNEFMEEVSKAEDEEEKNTASDGGPSSKGGVGAGSSAEDPTDETSNNTDPAETEDEEYEEEMKTRCFPAIDINHLEDMLKDELRECEVSAGEEARLMDKCMKESTDLAMEFATEVRDHPECKACKDSMENVLHDALVCEQRKDRCLELEIECGRALNRRRQRA